MTTWILFLRAVNVGKRPFPMAQLRAVLTRAGYADVETHIQTGNVRLDSPTRSRAKIEQDVEDLLARDRGFSIDVVALTPKELTALAEDVESLAARHPAEHGHYVSLLKRPATPDQVATVENHGFDDEVVVVRGQAVHFLYGKPYHEARMSNAAVEKRIGVATNRNAKVIRALAAKWGA